MVRVKLDPFFQKGNQLIWIDTAFTTGHIRAKHGKGEAGPIFPEREPADMD